MINVEKGKGAKQKEGSKNMSSTEDSEKPANQVVKTVQKKLTEMRGWSSESKDSMKIPENNPVRLKRPKLKKLPRKNLSGDHNCNSLKKI